jgi:aminopeptidase N
VTLEYLSVHDGNGARAYEAYKSANNMTQRSTALVTLTNDYPTSSDAQAALADFKSRYSDNPLVMDKWLAIQARMPGDAALDHVKTLMSDDVYDANNPNRIRSLIGTFAAGNATGFNRPDGGGYQLLAEQVLELDGKNPQVAARLLTAMRSWRSLEPVRRDAAKTALEKIAAQENLSADVSDIVERTLAA